MCVGRDFITKIGAEHNWWGFSRRFQERGIHPHLSRAELTTDAAMLPTTRVQLCTLSEWDSPLTHFRFW